MSRQYCTVKQGELIHTEDCECTDTEIDSFYRDKGDIEMDKDDQ